MVSMWVVGFANLLDHSVESVVLVRGVRNDASCAIWLVNSVLALDDIAVTFLPLTLVVTGVRIFHSIFKLVLWVCVVVFMMMIFLVHVIVVMVNQRNVVRNWNAVMMIFVMNWMLMLDFNFISRRRKC
jgi:hypothetical protein